MTDRNGGIVHARVARRRLYLRAVGLPRFLVIGPVVDDAGDAQFLRPGDVLDADLRSHENRVGKLAEHGTVSWLERFPGGRTRPPVKKSR